MHQEEKLTCQLGWHPRKPPSYICRQTQNFIKKGKNIYTRGGGLGQNPQKTKEKNENKLQKTMEICN